jgi:hypothetical protein
VWKLAPDPRTAVHVKWIFARRLEGMSISGTARVLNERGVPCPSAADPGRNRHRSGEGWSAPTVKSILENPRYTGRQVWNRMAGDRDEADPRTGRPVQFPNLPQDWAISLGVAHTPLVGMREFTEAQAGRARRPAGDGGRRVYLLSGLVVCGVCGVCGRRMDSHWVNGRPGYRCRHGYNSSRPRTAGTSTPLYRREDRLLEHIALAVAPDRPVCADTGAADVASWSEGTRVICVRDGVEIRDDHDEHGPRAAVGGRRRRTTV